MNKLINSLWIFIALLGLSMQVSALEKEPFSEQRFAELQAGGAVVLIDIHATWCPTCARQQEILTEYRAANPDKIFHILAVDFDTEKQWVRHFRAPRQSTLLLYAGDTQFWFSVGETRAEIIAAELNKALAAQTQAQASL